MAVAADVPRLIRLQLPQRALSRDGWCTRSSMTGTDWQRSSRGIPWKLLSRNALAPDLSHRLKQLSANADDMMGWARGGGTH